jgi:hypothetical protein
MMQVLLWEIALCILADVYRRFGGNLWLRLSWYMIYPVNGNLVFTMSYYLRIYLQSRFASFVLLPVTAVNAPDINVMK